MRLCQLQRRRTGMCELIGLPCPLGGCGTAKPSSTKIMFDIDRSFTSSVSCSHSAHRSRYRPASPPAAWVPSSPVQPACSPSPPSVHHPFLAAPCGPALRRCSRCMDLLSQLGSMLSSLFGVAGRRRSARRSPRKRRWRRRHLCLLVRR